jgi:hypothetical protein
MLGRRVGRGLQAPFTLAVHAIQRRPMSTKLPLHINGKSVVSKATQWFDVHDPATQELVCQVCVQDKVQNLLRHAPALATPPPQ